MGLGHVNFVDSLFKTVLLKLSVSTVGPDNPHCGDILSYKCSDMLEIKLLVMSSLSL